MYQSEFSKDELRGRRATVCDAIGDATALIAGAPASSGTAPFRQYNDFYYLCGVEVMAQLIFIQWAEQLHLHTTGIMQKLPQ